MTARPTALPRLATLAALALLGAAAAPAHAAAAAAVRDVAQEGTQPGPSAATATATTPDRTAATARERVVEHGIATWYGRKHSKRYTVSGERFDPRKMTAAHRNLPIGTMVRVTDRSTGRSVTVRINDREPPHGVRVIDLSEGAAKALGIHRSGIAPVTITALTMRDAVEVAEAPERTR